jgi:hypothetical protein
MENTNNTNPTGTSNGNQPKVDSSKHLCTIQCAIRRRPGLVALPGQDPAERVYKIGASLDNRTKGNLKGISGDLELKFMPEIVGLSANDPQFRRAVEEYWSSIGRPVPADEPFLKDHEKGIKINIQFHILGEARKQKFAKLLKVEEKIEQLNIWLVTKNASDEYIATLDFDSVSDYLLLTYSLKYSKVANTFEDVDKSPKIEFYIFEKEVSVKNQLSAIELRKSALRAYQDLEENQKQVDAVLLLFEKNPNDFDNLIDKLLAIDELYNESPAKMKIFVDYVGDSNWELKALVRKAITTNKLRTPVNSTAVYHGDTLLGVTLEEAVLFLKNEEKGKAIYANLLKETETK